MKLALGSVAPFHVFYARIVESSSAGIIGQLVHSLRFYTQICTNPQSNRTTTKYVFYFYIEDYASQCWVPVFFLDPLRLENFLYKSLHAKISFLSIEICVLNEKKE